MVISHRLAALKIADCRGLAVNHALSGISILVRSPPILVVGVEE
jgi:hypothetical protein